MEETDEQIYRRIQGAHGQKGGDATLRKHGTDHFSTISKKGVEARKQKKP